ncbi:murein biosynthesis integral membrane protein MurJ [Oceanobacter mangrovi]|uniref:murein biosynthesis integral membrane protein MurJ n=1 Tax=Oceanobacter mangrovi TaxID=2862510 RepID=UPI001C8D6A6A|nr:murein biosynthesis integral membrane protein MurJ [Oceanobacter mangrovi]
MSAEKQNATPATAGKSSNSLLKSSSIVSVFTLLSRVLGLVRDVIVAQYFGARVDPFLVAFKIPNFFRRLFAEGAFSVAFVPVLSEYRTQRSLADVQLLVSRVSGTLGMAVLGVTVVALLFSDYLPWLFAPGFAKQPEKFAMTGELLRITFPYLFFITMTALAAGILNSYGRFAVPAFTPVLLNLVLIATTIFATDLFEEPLFALAWGVFFAGLIQLLFQLPFLARLQLLVRPTVTRGDEGVIRIVTLMVPALFGVSVSQINLLLDTMLASFLESGSVSWLYYADRLNNLPLGIFAIAIGVVILPALSSKHAAKEADAFARTIDWAIRMVLLLALPAALALALLARPLMATIFFHGEMTAYDVGQMSTALQAYAAGLLAFMLIKVLAPGYYARQDTKTPVRIGIQAMVVNMVMNLALVFSLAHVGLALATSLSSYFNALMLYLGLRKSEVYVPQPGWWRFLLKLVAANLVMGAVVVWLAGDVAQWLTMSSHQRIGQMSAVVLAGVVAYIGTLLAVGLRPRHLRGALFD